jgi:hypothetical protein
MRSKRRVEPLDSFELEIPITRQDVAVQWQVRAGATLSSREYLDWCSWITRDSVAPCRDFHREPFEL